VITPKAALLPQVPAVTGITAELGDSTVGVDVTGAGLVAANFMFEDMLAVGPSGSGLFNSIFPSHLRLWHARPIGTCSGLLVSPF
jgi:hypothetical protein